MKKTVFLLCLIFFIVPFTNVNTVGNPKTFNFDNFNIIIEDYYREGNNGFTVEKTGTDPFYTIIYDDSESYIINGVIQANNNFIIFGSNHIEGNSTYYDSMFIVVDQFGNFISQTTYDFDDLEEIVGAYYINDTLIFHTIKTTDDGYDYAFVTNYFSAYDMSYNLVDTIEISTSIKKITSNERFILFNYEYDNLYNGAIRDDLSIMLPTDIIDIANQEIFINEVTIDFLNTATLNNEIVENGVYLNYPGNYQLLHNNSEYNFVIKPIVLGIEDNQTYFEGISPTISSGNIMLNNDLFISGTEISTPGNYELIITGLNGYQELYNFTIVSNMEGITNNHTYQDPLIISFNGEGYLNNQFITSPIEVSEVGEYILKIKGENNYLETYYFQLENPTETFTMVDFIQKFDIFILIVVLISGGILLKKK